MKPTIKVPIPARLLGLALCALLSVAGCSQDEPSQGAPAAGPPAGGRGQGFIETGDLQALSQHGVLRILSPHYDVDTEYLPRNGSALDGEQELAAAFARRIGLEPVLVTVARFGDLIPALLEGRGDLIAANLTLTDARKARIAFTVPIGQSREQVIVRAGEKTLSGPGDLAGRSVSVGRDSSFWQTLERLSESVPDITLSALPEGLGPEQILDRLAAGDMEITVMDSNVIQPILAYRDDVKVAFELGDERALAWGVRPDNPELLAALNRFLNQEQLTRGPVSTHLDGWEGIKRRKVLRLLTRNSAATYFLWRGELLGFEYELAREFARRQGLRLEVGVAPSRERLLPMLTEGKGDVVAALLTPTPEREAMGVAFSRPYHYASELVVARAEEPPLDDVTELAGRTLVVRRSSSYWHTLQDLKARGIDLVLEPAPETLETEEIIARVASGEYDLSVADSNILDIELTWREDVRSALALTEPRAHGWAVRAGDRKLLKAIDRFFKKEYRGLFYNITYKKYFKDRRTMARHGGERIKPGQGGRLSPYDGIVRRYAEQYGFDWRLLVAQMYQESRFDPKATSWAGAKGLMQVMPRTAREIGLKDLEDPETGIQAGVRYLNWVRERFSKELPVTQRMWFALAAYNAGPGHVHDARRLARQKGWDPDRWFGQVERAMLLLSKRQYARKARHGYVRGREPVRYVRNIRERFGAYAALTQRMAQAEAPGRLTRYSAPARASARSAP
jgi:membrane-bound lytic murein transglycosylase F